MSNDDQSIGNESERAAATAVAASLGSRDVPSRQTDSSASNVQPNVSVDEGPSATNQTAAPVEQPMADASEAAIAVNSTDASADETRSVEGADVPAAPVENARPPADSAPAISESSASGDVAPQVQTTTPPTNDAATPTSIGDVSQPVAATSVPASSAALSLSTGDGYFQFTTEFEAIDTISAGLRATPFDGTANANGQYDIDLVYTGPAQYQAAFDAAKAKWEAVILSDLADGNIPDGNGGTIFVDDLRIEATIEPIDGVGGILGSAGPTFIRNAGGLPIAGSMTFDSADIANLAAAGTLNDVILHEMGHVIGIGTLWQNAGLTTAANPFEYTGGIALAEYQALTGNIDAFIPVENDGGPGTAGGHWEESIFDNEIMTGFLGGANPGNPISRMTIASLEDMGYAVDYSEAQAFALPTDITAGNVAVSSANVFVGGDVTVTFDISNINLGNAFTTDSGIYLSTDATITTGDTLLTTELSLSSGGAGTTDSESVLVTLSNSLAPGTYFIGVIADQPGVLAETNENNNASTGVQITVTAPVDPVELFDGGNVSQGTFTTITDAEIAASAGYRIATVAAGYTANPESVLVDLDNLTFDIEAGVTPNLTLIGSAVTATLTGAGNGNITGNGLANTLVGNSGNNTLDGGLGSDTMTGGLGDDVYVSNSYGDIITEAVGQGNDTIQTSFNVFVQAGSEIENVETTDAAGTDGLVLVGNEFDQTLTGNAGANVLSGLGGTDTAIGGLGNDIYVVDSATDIVIEVDGQGSDGVYTTVDYTLAAGVSIERFVATPFASTNAIALTGNDLGQVMIGNAGVNFITGNGGQDSLYGFGGNDILESGAGNDFLFGGTGVDRFRFLESEGTASGIDRIFDLTAADNIQFDAVAEVSLRQVLASEFVLGSAALDADDRVLYDTTDGTFRYDPDGSGAQVAILFGVVDGVPQNIDHTYFEIL